MMSDSEIVGSEGPRPLEAPQRRAVGKTGRKGVSVRVVESAQPTARTGARASAYALIRERRQAAGQKQVAFWFGDELRRRLKIAAILDDTSVNALVVRVLDGYLAKRADEIDAVLRDGITS